MCINSQTKYIQLDCKKYFIIVLDINKQLRVHVQQSYCCKYVLNIDQCSDMHINSLWLLRFQQSPVVTKNTDMSFTLSQNSLKSSKIH